MAHLSAELDRIAQARARAHAGLKKADTDKAKERLEAELAGHTRTECALRDHVTLGRWLRQASTVPAGAGQGRDRRRSELDGKYLLSTSDQHLSPAEVALGYKACSPPSAVSGYEVWTAATPGVPPPQNPGSGRTC